jgi:hypothetical protein
MAIRCDRCGKDFRFRYLLEAHANRKFPCSKVDVKVDGYGCRYCDARFKYVQGRSRHEKSCEDKPPNIELNTFGNEDVEWLDHTELKRTMGEDYEPIREQLIQNGEPDHIVWVLLKLVYFNADTPENNTIRIKNRKDHIYMVQRQGGRWGVMKERKLVDEMLSFLCYVLDGAVCKYGLERIGSGADADFDKVYV